MKFSQILDSLYDAVLDDLADRIAERVDKRVPQLRKLELTKVEREPAVNIPSMWEVTAKPQEATLTTTDGPPMTVQMPQELPQMPEERRCRECGCTEDDCLGCIERTGEPCHWVEWDFCSACALEDAVHPKTYPEEYSWTDQEKIEEESGPEESEAHPIEVDDPEPEPFDESKITYLPPDRRLIKQGSDEYYAGLITDILRKRGKMNKTKLGNFFSIRSNCFSPSQNTPWSRGLQLALDDGRIVGQTQGNNMFYSCPKR